MPECATLDGFTIELVRSTLPSTVLAGFSETGPRRGGTALATGRPEPAFAARPDGLDRLRYENREVGLFGATVRMFQEHGALIRESHRRPCPSAAPARYLIEWTGERSPRMSAHDEPDLNQVVAELFKMRPESAVDWYGLTLGQPLPEYDAIEPKTMAAKTLEGPFTDRVLPLAILRKDGEAVHGLLYDVLKGPNDEQAMLWLPAIGGAQEHYGCPVALVVPCVDVATAKWALAYSKWEDRGCYALPLLVPKPEDFASA